MKRLVCFLAAALLLIPARAEVSARGAILMEFESGRVLYEKNADEFLALASTTKVMTCLLALERCSLDEPVTAGPNASGVPGTSIYLAQGETLTMEEMLYGLMLRSGNDAAVAIAEHIASDTESFAELMNARAAELGAQAHFTTPNGLDKDNNGATARALALISREAMKNADFRRIVSTTQKNIPWVDHGYMRVLTNKNRLLTTYEGALGIKTGFTSRAGRCLAFAAQREGMTVIGAVLCAPDWFQDAANIMDEAFENYHMETILQTNTVLGSYPVTGSGGKEVSVSAQSELRLPIKEGEQAEVVMRMLPLTAPIPAGQVCGTASIVLEGKTIAETALIACEEVPERTLGAALRRVIHFWPSNIEP